MSNNGKFQFKRLNELHLKRALNLVWQSAPSWTLVSAALIIVKGALPLVTLYLMKLIVDAVTAGITAADKGEAFKHIALLVGIAGGVTLLSSLFNSISGLVSGAQSQRVTDHVQSILHAKSIEVDLEYYENSKYYDTLHRAQQEAPFRPTRVVNGLVQIGQSAISLLAMAGLLLSFHWGIAILLFVTVIPGIIVRLKYAGKMYRWQREQTPTERQAWYFNWMLTGDTHAKEIRLFDLGSLFINRFRDLRKNLYKERLEIAVKRSASDFIAQIGATLAIFGSYFFIGYRTIQGAITMGDLVMYYQAFQRGQGFLREMLSNIAGLYEDNLFLSNLYEFLDLKPKVAEPVNSYPVPKPVQRGIVFNYVSFQYPTGNKKVLENINLTIRPGEVVALVGENGSGKTTLVKLLCRLYDPTNGKITLDGVDLHQFKTAELRREISVIFQDYARYHLTARENVWFGNVDLPSDHERIVTAAQHSGADNVISGFKNGYETILGKWFENGEELSIGEWQKVALARAFLRDAQIIILDEPTSAMDAKTEYEIFKKFQRMSKGKTTLIISHRFSTVRMADTIHVLDNGRIVESGCHEDLVHRGGKYAGMFEMQAEAYR